MDRDQMLADQFNILCNIQKVAIDKQDIPGVIEASKLILEIAAAIEEPKPFL